MNGRRTTWGRRCAAVLCAAAVLATAGCLRLGRDQDTRPTAAEETLHLFDAYAQGITDPVLGHTVQVTGVGYGLPDLDSSGKYPMVLIRVKATADPKQRSPYLLSCADLNLRHGAAVKSDHYHPVNTSLSAVGLRPLRPVEAGDTAEGWCAYLRREDDADDLQVEYSRERYRDDHGKWLEPAYQLSEIEPESEIDWASSTPTEPSPSPAPSSPDSSPDGSADDSTESEPATPSSPTVRQATSDWIHDEENGTSVRATGVVPDLRFTPSDDATSVAVRVQVDGSRVERADPSALNRNQQVQCANFRLWGTADREGARSEGLMRWSLETLKDEDGKALKELPDLDLGQDGQGWCIFKVHRPDLGDLQLEYVRPAFWFNETLGTDRTIRPPVSALIFIDVGKKVAP